MTLTSYTLSDILFALLGALSIFFAMATVVTPHILRAATYLMGVLSLSAGFYVLLGAELLAGIQLLVYVGGILVLLVIAVMLTHNNPLSEPDPSSRRQKVLAFLASGGFYAISSSLLSKSSLAQKLTTSTPQENIKSVGIALLDPGAGGFLLPFELISLLLLTVLVAGIVIARKASS